MALQFRPFIQRDDVKSVSSSQMRYSIPVVHVSQGNHTIAQNEIQDGQLHTELPPYGCRNQSPSHTLVENHRSFMSASQILSAAEDYLHALYHR